MKKIIILLPLFLFSCASHPVLYPNDKYQNVGEESAKTDVQICEKKADKFLKSSKGKQILKSAGSGAAMGGVIGAVTGLFTGDFIKSVVRGGAIGTAAGATAGAITPDRLKQNFTTKCLQDQGYQVIGWD
ncbi:MAG: cell envelope biogenesis protein OmpA [Bdellovibrio sp. CG12_big_fil_rev_8_21_14_0_65_39_13]|nr:MAG: cell envelope biogenesis protein OmpA [Bdellovibrio sp. CG22_combo_CG10-13_8_21_14_all_39_27]PIQ61041.1 MAG: cell envelope biogenesis protein OmpA [Bdellovibrio sp. CG12_big_fil_rev_8_21_14_0_65_39_13]PIR36808.1 MAG: cell envelope biogenesis protein OmpA [Bdellovibrio sp. CG11_big_fil_rev_8_21_14_0_20_39_38]